ncbi:hypothetical protein [Methanobrevibacter arboriphilus]|uniref:hypothetical protein n=1 Tax=Methanobrevibacter arboriphilus TaxID=39441 RepID=UPI000693FE1C|nr:hypothetical protein [Methanobrevibacter arboriphilus]
MKNMKNKILIISIILATLFLSVSFVCAEDVEISDNNTTNNQTNNNTTVNQNNNTTGEGNSTVDNSNTSIKTPKKPSKVSQSSVIAASKKVKAYADRYKKLPNYITISKYKFSMPEFFYLMSKTISYKNSKIKSNVVVKYNIKNPSKASGKWVRGNIYSYYYSIYANKIIKYINKYNKAPNYLVTAGGNKLQYQSNIYLFANALSKTKTKLPYYVNIDIKAGHPINKYMPYYNRNKPVSKLLGKDSRGYVELLGPYGNLDSKIKIAYIIGMHPLENNSHSTLYKTLTSSKNLKYAYYIYKITVTQNPKDYNNGRMNGQLLAQKYILPNIKLNKYNLVIDVHSNKGTKDGGSYKKTNFIFAPKNSASSKVIANKIIKNIPGLSYYYPSPQTSPPYCTEPLVKAGIKTIIYETYLNESTSTTLKYIKKLISEVDKLSF